MQSSRRRSSSQQICKRLALAYLYLSPQFEIVHFLSATPTLPCHNLTVKHPDYMLSEQLSKILEKYTCLLVQLKFSFRGTLKKKEDYEKSIKDNEDGFFLSLYKLVAEG